jgi:hypothetical protein
LNNVLACIDDLHAQVRQIDPVLFSHAYGPKEVAEWVAIASGDGKSGAASESGPAVS